LVYLAKQAVNEQPASIIPPTQDERQS